MRRWVGNLHVGQLIMLVLAIALAGAVPATIGAVYVGWARSGMDAPEALMHGAQHQGTLGLMWIGAGLAVWLLVLPMLWIWFAARRRGLIVAEIIE